MPRTNEETVRARQERAICALLLEPTLDKAAARAHIGASTIDRWLRDDAFVAEYRAARRRALEGAVGSITASLAAAAATLQRNLNCGHHQTELRCALALFDLAYRDAELSEFESRLGRLETQLGT